MSYEVKAYPALGDQLVLLTPINHVRDCGLKLISKGHSFVRRFDTKHVSELYMSTPSSNTDFMRLALIHGRLALPECLPNPPVGCVLVKDNVVVSQGHTQQPGQCHAEALALSRLPSGCDGFTAYVTLEPCSFHGRTPSCAQALVKSGVKSVFVGMLDPDPRNSGAGIKILRDAGITVVVGLLAQEAEEYLSSYLMTPQ